jgi:hypothetical protein
VAGACLSSPRKTIVSPPAAWVILEPCTTTTVYHHGRARTLPTRTVTVTAANVRHLR